MCVRVPQTLSLCLAAGIIDKDVSLMNGILFPINLCCVGNGKRVPAPKSSDE